MESVPCVATAQLKVDIGHITSQEGKVVASAIMDFLEGHDHCATRGAYFSEVLGALASFEEPLVREVFWRLVVEGDVLEHDGMCMWL